MELGVVLSWVTTMMQNLGLYVFVSAFLVIMLVIVILDRLFGHK